MVTKLIINFFSTTRVQVMDQDPLVLGVVQTEKKM